MSTAAGAAARADRGISCCVDLPDAVGGSGALDSGAGERSSRGKLPQSDSLQVECINEIDDMVNPAIDSDTGVSTAHRQG